MPYFIADLHVHPSLKVYLFGYNLERNATSPRGTAPWAFRTSLPALRQGGVRLLWSSLVIPEREMFQQCGLLRSWRG